MKKLIVLVFFSAINLLAFSISKDQAKTIFEQGNQHYQAGNYEEAKSSYLQLEESFVSFDLFYNLGNTYYKLNDIPSAILYYERAKKIDPSNEDLTTNLQIANLKVVDKIDKLPTLAIADFGSSFISKEKLSLWAWLSIISMALAAIAFILYMRLNGSSKSRLFLTMGVLFILSSIGTYAIGSFGKSQLMGGTEAIIFSSKVDVLNQPNGDKTVFVLHEGTKVNLRNEQDNWLEIKIDNGSVGWIKSEDCKEI